MYAVVGLAVLLVLWPTESSGRRFLRRWGVSDPDERQTALAVSYLRNRRLLYPPLLLLGPALADVAIDRPGDPGFLTLLAPVIVALLLAETIGALRKPTGPRIAALTKRHWRDLAPRWAMATMLTLAATAVGLAVAGLIAQPWANRIAAAIPRDGVWTYPDGSGSWTVPVLVLSELTRPSSVITLAGIAIGLAAVLGLVRLAVRRRPIGDPRLDAALRTRTARVAVGIGIAWMAAMVVLANNRLTFLRTFYPPSEFPSAPSWLAYTSAGNFLGVLLLFVAAAGWIWAANPPRRLPYVEAAR